MRALLNRQDNQQTTSIRINPLLELQKASMARGIADEHGRRLSGAPWAFALAELVVSAPPSSPSTTSHDTEPQGNLDADARQQQQHQHQPPHPWTPSVRTIGFQRISEHGLDWLVKRRRRRDPAPTATATTKVLLPPVALCYTHGMYPPAHAGDDGCEQWRAEGQPMELPVVAELFHTAPRQSLAVQRLEQELIIMEQQQHQQQQQQPELEQHLDLPETRQAYGSHRTHHRRRFVLTDRDAFLAQVAQVTQELEQGRVALEELASAVQVLRLRPDRMELLAHNAKDGIWERWEWTRQQRGGGHAPDQDAEQDDDDDDDDDDDVVVWEPASYQLLPY
ncbi:hypothetical protein ACA910_015835 [Epithemia clementina (nom. ined.)]